MAYSNYTAECPVYIFNFFTREMVDESHRLYLQLTNALLKEMGITRSEFYRRAKLSAFEGGVIFTGRDAPALRIHNAALNVFNCSGETKRALTVLLFIWKQRFDMKAFNEYAVQDLRNAFFEGVLQYGDCVHVVKSAYKETLERINERDS